MRRALKAEDFNGSGGSQAGLRDEERARAAGVQTRASRQNDDIGTVASGADKVGTIEGHQHLPDCILTAQACLMQVKRSTSAVSVN